MKIFAGDTAAIFIDFQEKLIPAIHDNENVVKKAAILAQGLAELGVPFIVTQQYTKGLGETVPEVKDVIENFSYMEKTSFSALGSDEVCEWVKTAPKNIIVCGTETHICVLQTVVDLLEEGYNVFVPADCVGSRTPLDKEMAFERFRVEGAILTSCEAMLFEMTGGAKSPHFKTISKLIK